MGEEPLTFDEWFISRKAAQSMLIDDARVVWEASAAVAMAICAAQSRGLIANDYDEGYSDAIEYCITAIGESMGEDE